MEHSNCECKLKNVGCSSGTYDQAGLTGLGLRGIYFLGPTLPCRSQLSRNSDNLGTSCGCLATTLVADQLNAVDELVAVGLGHWNLRDDLAAPVRNISFP